MQNKIADWQYLPLAEIAANSLHSFVDGPFGSDLKSDEYTTEGIRLIQLQNIGDGEWMDENKKFISEKKFMQLKRHAAYPGDIAIAKMADPIARACILPFVSDRFVVVADCIKLTPDFKKFNSKYVVYAINYHSARKQAELKSTGTTRQRINLSLLKTVEIPAPSLTEQNRIAEILDAIDGAIQKTDAAIEKLKAIKQGLLTDLIRGQQAITASIGDIAVYVGSGLTPRGGSYVYKKTGAIFIRSQNVIFDGLKLDEIAYIDLKTHKIMQRSEVFPYDVLLNITGASIGRCCIVPEGFGQANVNQHVCAIRLPDPSQEDALFLSSVMSSNIGQHQIDIFNAGGNREGLNYQQLKSIKVPWPEKDERTHVVNILSAHNDRIHVEEAYRDKLRLQKNGLMNDLLTGKVRVEKITEEACQ